MKEYFYFLKDKSLVSAFFILLLIEGLMQFGCYKIFLKKSSYASNVNRITDHAIYRKKEIDPDILIVGTSLAYEGISIRLLNEKLKPLNLKAQSIAIPGSELIVQELALEKVLSEFKNVKFIIHVNEAEMPWTLDKVFSNATIAMAGQFNRKRAIEKLIEDDYKISFADVSFILFRLWAYRNDLGDFLLNPHKRIRDLIKSQKTFQDSLYTYENANLESMELYSFQNLKECMEITKSNAPIPNGSNHFHKDAIYKTCRLASETNLPLMENESTQLYKKRLSNFYREIRGKNIRIINVFPPLSNYLENHNFPDRIKFWKEKYGDILGEKTLDLTGIIPKKNNASYFYDIVHPNEKGMKLFTEKLGESLEIYLLETRKEFK